MPSILNRVRAPALRGMGLDHAHVRFGSWLCKNSEMRNRDRITISSKLSFNARKFVGVLKFGRSEEAILLCFQFLAFLHMG